MQLPRRLIWRLGLGIESVDAAHGRGGAFDDLRFDMMHEVEHRFDKGTTTETDQRNALSIGSVSTRGMPGRTVKEKHGALRCGEPNLIGMVGGTRRRFDSLKMDTRHMTCAAVFRCEVIEQPETVGNQGETG